ncbi:glycosaminoglycan xylosylkinase homolog [Condylostylus longicornis]|uniref:glycosaminoglycan xylosylkinase homolog n=1 Tax=Condylostylus longicornis TaxID=2530218 RepID=UPI00244DE9A2|nr:glycosaminoglycan xylosylkinase homolog [Condylostylus longicornis]
MISKKKIYVFAVCGALTTILYYIANIVFLCKIYENEIENNFNVDIEKIIREYVGVLEPQFLNVNPRFSKLRLKLITNFKYSDYNHSIWDVPKNWISYKHGLYNPDDSSIGKLLKALKFEPILKVSNALKGTQLKLLLHLNSSQKVLFKPQWYSKETVIEGPVYSGKDRHSAEIYSFYLGAVLNISWMPLVVGRKINLQEVYQKGDLLLKKTMFIKATGEYCLFGKCYYCRKEEYICGDNDNLIEGAAILIIPGILKKVRSPWQRTYKNHLKAKWEENKDYCKSLKKGIDHEKLLDYVDLSIFDFLIQNGDRHHYEIMKGNIIFLDNGKSFGNPNKVFFDILAPLYQCCLIRNTTWNNLQIVSGGTLTSLVDEILKSNEQTEIITEYNKRAVEQRLLFIYAAVNYCIKKFGVESVFTTC